MLSNFSKLTKILKESPSVFNNHKLVKVIQEFSFIFISENDELTKYFEENQLIKQNIQDSKVIMIDKNDLRNENAKDKFIILCFEKTLIILKQTMISSIYALLSSNLNLSVCFLKNTKDIFTEQISNPLIEYNEIFEEEIKSFNSELHLNSKIDTSRFWPIISPCISAYLIKKSYFKINNDRIQSFNDFKNNPNSLGNVDQEDYITLRALGSGSLFIVELIYHIERCELFALKKQKLVNNEVEKLIEREKLNYQQIQHPLIPKFYGIVKNNDLDFLIIDFINGQTLDEYKFDGYDENDIIIIIIKLLFIVEFIHDKKNLIRDLKPNNIMITGKNDIVMIDLDRIINDSTQTYSHEMYNKYAAPEVNSTKVTSIHSEKLLNFY